MKSAHVASKAYEQTPNSRIEASHHLAAGCASYRGTADACAWCDRPCTDKSRLFGNRLLQYAHGESVLSISINLFLNELHLGKLSETVIVHGNAPHNRPRFLVSHLIGNRASFPARKRQCSGSETSFLDGMGSGYDECIGAKKHLVLGLLSHAGSPPKGSCSFAIG